MKLIDALKLDRNIKHIISIVGAGGKTTTMFTLAEELKVLGKRVLITTTTAFFIPDSDTYDRLFVESDIDKLLIHQETQKNGSITVIGRCEWQGEKLKGIQPEWIEALSHTNQYDVILVEADGAKRKPIKAPNRYEPVIPTQSTMVIGCVGFDSIGKKINEQWVHRAEIFSTVVGQKLEEVISYETINRLVLSKEGLFKTCNEQHEKVVLINKVSNNDGLVEVQKLGGNIVKQDKNVSKVIIGSVQSTDPILMVIEGLGFLKIKI